MATLAESFLADLDDLSDASGDEDFEAKDENGDVEVCSALPSCPYPAACFVPTP